ncbi:MAG: SpoIID/LytB domain-containing protein [Butyrivibrio sp.]|nr:SpoIID/LytB domain-containing protein [Butyrivibrio sp.]
MYKKRLLLIVTAAGVFALTAALLILSAGRREDNRISKSLASKMLVLLETDKAGAEQAPDCFDGKGNGEWYEKYINFMKAKGYGDFGSGREADKAFTYGDLQRYFTAKGISGESVNEATGIEPFKHKENKKISKEDFNEIYKYLAAVYGSENGVTQEELVISGTPSNTEQAARWQAVTANGLYGFEGLALDRYIDCKILAYVKNNEIINVIVKLSDDVVYRNVWLEEGRDNRLVAYIGGVKREFSVGKLELDFSQTVGDIYMSGGRVKSVSLKSDTVGGKVLMVSDSRIELENYGVLELDEDFHVYKTYGRIEEVDASEILVGYDLSDFIVADRKICAAVISRTLTADNIRVLVMSTGFTSIFHERVSLTGTTDFTVKCGEREELHKAGDIVDIYKGASLLEQGRVIVEPKDVGGKIRVLSVEKAQGAPEYRGRLEVAEYDEGLVLVNDVLIEEYLYAVVPSEMPNRFGVEALKVQAVCARSYAYRQLKGNSYAKYGAHVDDSVNFQVYNNVSEQEASTEAVRETYGEVAAYDGNPISTYYYSTSCGSTSDTSVWGGNAAGAPYLLAKSVNPEHKAMDLSSEESFAEFIKNTDEKDFDYGFGYYRWRVRMPYSEITTSVNEYIYSRYCANPANIRVERDGEWVSEEIGSVGRVTKIEILQRSSGGAVTEMIIYGTEAAVRVSNELNIRYLLSPRNNPITLLKGDTTTFYILPSAYCMFEEYSEDGEEGYDIIGGGYGHGIGMSQNAVSNMVAYGMSYDEILKFFFDGIELIDVYRSE